MKPFLNKDKWVILLAHTSNPGSSDFQLMESVVSGRKLYEEVILKSKHWASPDQIMYVVGATQAEKIESIRALAPEHFFLVPGIGAQGGDLHAVDCEKVWEHTRAAGADSDYSDSNQRARFEFHADNRIGRRRKDRFFSWS